MFITVAGVKKEIKDGITIAELIDNEKINDAQYVSVTVNDDFIDRGDFESKALVESDTVEFLYFMGGGSF